MFFAQALTAMFAFFCLPRQFHIGVVECADVADVRRARLVVRRLSRAAQHRRHSDRRGFVAARCRGPQRAQHRRAGVVVPLAAGQEWLALFAYLGGFSAATGMVIVASVALATMISNDLVLPMLWRWRLHRLRARASRHRR